MDKVFVPKHIYKNMKKKTYCVIWDDDEKTIIHLQPGDKWDDEKALAICYVKRLFNNNSKFNDTLNAWCRDAGEKGDSKNIEVIPNGKENTPVANTPEKKPLKPTIRIEYEEDFPWGHSDSGTDRWLTNFGSIILKNLTL